jgi:hypothetical protein
VFVDYWTCNAADTRLSFVALLNCRYVFALSFQVHWMGVCQNFETPSLLGFQADSVDRWFFHVPLGDSSFVWLTDKGCRFPGPCPRNPLEGGVLPISEDFDFEGARLF